jgi:hypothetical protein
MIVWGSGGDILNLGTLETSRCEVCEKDRPFNLILQYRYWGLYWIFNFVTEKKYMLLCDVCQRGWELESSKVEGVMKSVPIPFMRRFGFLVLIAIIVGLAILGSLGGSR